MLSRNYQIKSDISKFNIDFLDSELDNLHYSEKVKFDVRLITEEILTNIMKYSKCTEDIHLTLIFFNENITIKIADSGIKFNPLKELELTNTSNKEIDNIKTEGLGILLAKEKSKDIFYKRIGKFNIMSMHLNTV